MKILITGSSGQIGSFVVEEALLRGHEPVGMDLRPGPRTVHVGDIRSTIDCERALGGVHAVIHCAAQISVAASVTQPLDDASTNVLGTLTLLEACKRARIGRFVYISSAAVYGNPENAPVREDHPTRPLSPYGLSKLTGERYARLYHDLNGLDAVAVRPFNVYSPRQDPDNPYSGVISKMTTRVLAGKPPVVHGDGQQSRDFIHARDVARWLVDLADGTAEVPGGTVMNLGSGQETSIDALARHLMDAAGIQGAPDYQAPRAGDVRRSVADPSCAKRYGFEATIDLREGIQEMLIAAAASSQAGPRPKRITQSAPAAPGQR